MQPNEYVQDIPTIIGVLLLALVGLILFISRCDTILESNRHTKFALEVVETIKRKIEEMEREWIDEGPKPTEFLYIIKYAHSCRPPLIWVVVQVGTDKEAKVEVGYRIEMDKPTIAEAHAIADVCRTRGYTTSCLPSESIPAKFEWV